MYYSEKDGDIYITSKGWSSMDKCLEFDDIYIHMIDRFFTGIVRNDIHIRSLRKRIK